MTATLLTKEQLQQIQAVFGLSPVRDTITVRDGVVTRTATVWWRAEHRPVRIVAEVHWDNIKEHPHLYQIAEPTVKVTYED